MGGTRRRARFGRWKVAAAGLLFYLLAAVPGAHASHWCDEVRLTTAPTSALAGDKANYTVTVTNPTNQSLALAVRARFAWEASTLSWGSLQIPAGESRSTTASKVFTHAPADYAVTLTLQGNTTGEPATTCPAASRTLRLETMPDPPVVVILVDTRLEAQRNASFSLVTDQGVPPVSYAWSFGDGAISTGAHASHTFPGIGPYAVRVVATDGRGRVGTDEVVLSFGGPSRPGVGPSESAFVDRWGAFVVDLAQLVLLAWLALAVRRAFPRRRSPAAGEPRLSERMQMRREGGLGANAPVAGFSATSTTPPAADAATSEAPPTSPQRSIAIQSSPADVAAFASAQDEGPATPATPNEAAAESKPGAPTPDSADHHRGDDDGNP